jgi:hypothetical protein
VPVEKLGHKAIITFELSENGSDFTRCEHNRYFWRSFDPLNVVHEVELSIKDCLVKE